MTYFACKHLPGTCWGSILSFIKNYIIVPLFFLLLFGGGGEQGLLNCNFAKKNSWNFLCSNVINA